ncbi:phage portal protein [Agromyces atrinae]|uniref:Phage portal protein n=1 Tax=Agromyces atrinae TaxID=592376 RepID=A0A4Q2M8V8_9MICO|nr:phage portal protein [Agromyces atrinae]NYD65990.1 hypothetical protein [Agromyces atrinae]RXZ86322.1 phage portal protein [Agromyces atrinae]
MLFSPTGIASPWAESDGILHHVGPEIFGSDIASNLPISRDEAMTIPAVIKARNLLVATIAKFPLVALDKSGPLASQPAWLYRQDDDLSTYDRTAATVDDLFFNGRSLWTTTRGSSGILNASWIPSDRWHIDGADVVIDGVVADDRDFILFHIPLFDGVLKHGRRTIRGARDTELAWVAKMRNPTPVNELRIVDDTNLEQDEVDELRKKLDQKTAAGESVNMVTPAGVEFNAHGEVDPALYVEGRNAIRTDIGSFANVSVAMLDGTIGVDSLTYSTKEGEKNKFYEFDLPFWTDPIQAALSVDKVVPRGQRVRFDMYAAHNMPVPTGVPTEDD